MEQNDSGVENVENWDDIIASEDVWEIQDHLHRELNGLLRTWMRRLRGYSVVILYKHGAIDATDVDKLFQVLQKIDTKKRNNVLLIIESNGGDPRSGYQISKLCREWAADKFMVAVPRRAKSAATLIALGADQVHMGPLSELGPVDPLVGGIPGLAIQDSIETITQCVNDNPGESGAKLWADYLKGQFTFWPTRSLPEGGGILHSIRGMTSGRPQVRQAAGYRDSESVGARLQKPRVRD